MKQIHLRATAIALASAAASLLLVATIVPVLGGTVEGNALIMTLVCPLAIAWPASAYTLWQKQKLTEALAELTAAHDELAEAHSQLAAAHARLCEKARHDDMTGLLNRESFAAALKKTRRRTDSGTLLIIDADHFKQINDRYGHLQGDQALLLITAAIQNGVRDDDLVGRIGGEEFAVFLSGASEEDSLIVAERIRLNVEAIRFWPDEGKMMPLSVSIGAARVQPNVPWTEMMREADSRLYEAKRRGRNRVVFESVPAAA